VNDLYPDENLHNCQGIPLHDYGTEPRCPYCRFGFAMQALQDVPDSKMKDATIEALARLGGRL
jgi:hypothetical protein